MIERFTRAERALHWSLALTTFFLMGTGFWIWMGWARGHQLLGFKYGLIHFWVGGTVFLAAPLLFLALRRRRVAGHATRFNPGQKLNLLAMQVTLPFMLATGTALHFGKLVGIPREVRQLLKLVHLGAAGLITLAVLAHVFLVLKHRGLIRGMVTGHVAPEAVPDWSKEPVSPAPPPGSPRSPAAPAPGS